MYSEKNRSSPKTVINPKCKEFFAAWTPDWNPSDLEMKDPKIAVVVKPVVYMYSMKTHSFSKTIRTLMSCMIAVCSA